MTTPKATLESDCLVLAPDEPRHYLLGRAVHCGHQLEIQNGSIWLPVRYEADNPGDGTLYVTLHCRAGLLHPERNAVYRWP